VQGFDTPDQAEYIESFWNFLFTLDNIYKEKFLSFCTGADRPPLLGFKYLNPKFCVARMAVEDPKKNVFPTSSTCANMLRLPYFGNTEEGRGKMRDTLFEAINSNQGFYNA
jgi:ubiquitin-protein ligase E3 C